MEINSSGKQILSELENSQIKSAKERWHHCRKDKDLTLLLMEREFSIEPFGALAGKELEVELAMLSEGWETRKASLSDEELKALGMFSEAPLCIMARRERIKRNTQ